MQDVSGRPEALGGGPTEQLPHVAAWREAYRAFGTKPQRTRNSLEALLRRADTMADGIAVTEHPDPGEVAWCDDAGVTCRRWNWRQTRRNHPCRKQASRRLSSG